VVPAVEMEVDMVSDSGGNVGWAKLESVLADVDIVDFAERGAWEKGKAEEAEGLEGVHDGEGFLVEERQQDWFARNGLTWLALRDSTFE